jgi:tRNA(Ile)-lysidine synthase
MDADEPLSDDEIRALFEPLLGAPMAVAVSGGADSMALMHIAQRALDLVPPAVEGMRLPGRPRLIVLTVDHGLRTGSADDAVWVVSRAEASGLPCRVLAWTGDKPTQGIQAAARAARYQLMHEALVEEARPYHNLVRPLLTAHHYEDQAETFLMRLARGSGIDGLSAMQETALIATATMPDGAYGVQLTVHRPLLDFPKSRLIATLKAADLEWREDPSNARDDFERVRVRKALVTLAELGVTSDAIARSASRLSRARSAVMRQAADAVSRHIHWHDGQFGAMPLDALNELSEEIAIRVLTRLIGAFSGEAPDPRLSEVEALAERIRATTDRAWPARAATLGGCRIDWRPAGILRVWREAGRSPLATLRVPPGTESAVWDRRFAITTSPDLAGPIDVRALGTAGWQTLKAEQRTLAKLRLPPGAAATLPACWLGDRLIAVPGLPAPKSAQIGADFFGGRDRIAL